MFLYYNHFYFVGQGDEHDCVDIDECELFDNVCVHGKCENQNGLFKCFCDKGFKLGKFDI